MTNSYTASTSFEQKPTIYKSMFHGDTYYMYDTPVKEFHKAFGHPVADKPTLPPLDRRILRVKLLLEEVIEFARASGVQVDCYMVGGYSVVLTDGQACFTLDEGFSDEPDIVNAAKELSDLRYVVDGANLEYGFPINAVLISTHESNMSKLGEDGKPVYRADGKIMKGPNYKEPDTAGVLRKYGWS